MNDLRPDLELKTSCGRRALKLLNASAAAMDRGDHDLSGSDLILACRELMRLAAADEDHEFATVCLKAQPTAVQLAASTLAKLATTALPEGCDDDAAWLRGD